MDRDLMSGAVGEGDTRGPAGRVHGDGQGAVGTLAGAGAVLLV